MCCNCSVGNIGSSSFFTDPPTPLHFFKTLVYHFYPLLLSLVLFLLLFFRFTFSLSLAFFLPRLSFLVPLPSFLTSPSYSHSHPSSSLLSLLSPFLLPLPSFFTFPSSSQSHPSLPLPSYPQTRSRKPRDREGYS